MGQLDRMGPESDIYSLGATLYCILTGHAPLAEIHDVGEILRRAALGEIPSPRPNPDVPVTLEFICKKAMATRPEDRYASAVALAADIESGSPTSRFRACENPRAAGSAAEAPASHVHPHQRAGLFRDRHGGDRRGYRVNRARERAEDRRQQAVELGEIAEARKQEADRQHDELAGSRPV